MRDVALHVLDDDLGWLARGRDGDRSGLLDSSGDRRAFVAALHAKNERWVVGAAGLSRRVVTDLLEWTGAEVATYHATLDLTARSRVFWAGPGVVPLWFDLARDLTERWVHQRHIRDAVGRPGHHDRLLPEVLGTFVWAFPHQYRADAPRGTVVHLDMRPAGSWTLTDGATGWVLGQGPADAPALLRMAPEVAWRQLTGLSVGAQNRELEGPAGLSDRSST